MNSVENLYPRQKAEPYSLIISISIIERASISDNPMLAQIHLNLPYNDWLKLVAGHDRKYCTILVFIYFGICVLSTTNRKLFAAFPYLLR